MVTAAGAAALVGTASLTALAVSPAAADTNPIAGISTQVSTSTINTNVAPNGPLTGLADGTTLTVNINATGAAAGHFFGTEARLCKAGVAIASSAQYSPTTGGVCVNAPLSANSDDYASVSAAPTNNSVSFTFRVGTGTQTYTFGGTNTTTITCDSSHPCTLWLAEAYDNSAFPGNGTSFIHYDLNYAGPPGAPTGVTASGGDTTGTVSWAAPASNGGAPITSYVVTITDGVTPVTHTVSAATLSSNFTGLTNFTTYTATVVAKNTAADGTTQQPSANSSAATFAPAPAPNAGTPSGVPGNGKVDLSWSPAGGAVTDYEVTATPVNPAGADIVRLTGSTSPSYSFTGLTNGTSYTFKVRAKYGANFGGFSSSSPTIAAGAASITQSITVTRPAGALVLTQICGNNAARAANALYPGSPAIPAFTGGTAPTFNGAPDPLFNQYPYPTDPTTGVPNPNYVTDCGIALGNAKFVTSGPGAGQFFRADGLLSQVTVVDTRDSDPGWTATGTASSFSAGAGKSFGGGQLGWNPIKTSSTPSFTDASGNTYAMSVTAGAAVAANTSAASGGMSAGAPLGSAPTGFTTGTTTNGGLGIAVFDADLHLLIPVFAKTGTYTGTLTITAA